MVDGSLKTKITDLAVKAKIPNAVILVADKSKQTNKMNAYVTGIGDSSRIVLWDSTINRLPEDQVLAVVGHEIGHYSMHHIYWGFGMMVLATKRDVMHTEDKEGYAEPGTGDSAGTIPARLYPAEALAPHAELVVAGLHALDLDTLAQLCGSAA